MIRYRRYTGPAVTLICIGWLVYCMRTSSRGRFDPNDALFAFGFAWFLAWMAVFFGEMFVKKHLASQWWRNAAVMVPLFTALASAVVTLNSVLPRGDERFPRPSGEYWIDAITVAGFALPHIIAFGGLARLRVASDRAILTKKTVRCPQCGKAFNPVGLARCPECGWAFPPEEIDEQIGPSAANEGSDAAHSEQNEGN